MRPLMLLITMLALPRVAVACAACACGDPTLTSMGLEKPFRGRVRLGTTFVYRWELDDRDPRGTVRTERITLDLTASWVPHERFVLSLAVPVVSAAEHRPDLSSDRGTGLGDVAVRTRIVVLRDRAARHLGGFVLGLELPTTTPIRTPDGTLAPLDAQPGQGATSPQLGLWYGGFLGAWSVFASATVRSSTTGVGGVQPGVVLRTTTLVQWQPLRWIAPGLGVDTRVQADDRRDGATWARGGWMVALTPTLAVAPAEDWLITARVQIPLAQRRAGTEGVAPWLGVTVDL